MSAPAAGWISRISQQLSSTKKTLQDAVSHVDITMGFDVAEVGILERDVSEILLLLRSLINRHAPINRLPPEILCTIPDFLETRNDKTKIALTHVCQAWREIFTSRPSLWTMLGCNDADRTRVYLERSKSSPIGVELYRVDGLSPQDACLQVLPHATNRLKSLTICAPSEYIDDVSVHLSHPAPLLEELFIVIPGRGDSTPLLPIFTGNLPSLRELMLTNVATQLPSWRTVSLTTLALGHIRPGDISMTQFLDFLESAPCLREIQLDDATPTPDGQGGRLVALTNLKRMGCAGSEPCSPLLDHILVPSGALLGIEIRGVSPRLEDYLPRSLDNLRNLQNFTTADSSQGRTPNVRLNGPNGEVRIDFSRSSTLTLFGILTYFGTSGIERLTVVGDGPPVGEISRQTLLPMQQLCSLTLRRCEDQHIFIRLLSLNRRSSSAIVCPKLEELFLYPYCKKRGYAPQSVIKMAASRASAGVKLKTIGIVDIRGRFDPKDVSRLEECVSDVCYRLETGEA